MLWGRSGHIQGGNAGRLAVPSGRGEAVPDGLQVLHPRLHQRHIPRLPELVVRHRLHTQMKPSLVQHVSQHILPEATTIYPCLARHLQAQTLPLCLCLLEGMFVPVCLLKLFANSFHKL